MAKYPVVTIMNETLPGAQVFANFAWAGVIGSLAAYNGKIGLSE